MIEKKREIIEFDWVDIPAIKPAMTKKVQSDIRNRYLKRRYENNIEWKK